YRQVFDHTRLMHDSQAKEEFRTAHGGIVYATGADGTITGYGEGSMSADSAAAIIIDDPHQGGEANTHVMPANVIDWNQTRMESRKNSEDTPIILIMQRLHEHDLAGWLLDGGNGEEWENIKIPAITDSGDSFWPEQFPISMLERMQEANPYVFAGQYMQNPTPICGGEFKTG